jgi:hypothetical protein
MITLSGEYALRLMLHLEWSTYLKSHQVARKAHCPVGYASKILQQLEREGWVVSMRGRTGGYRRRMGYHPTVGTILGCFERAKPRPLEVLFLDGQALEWSLKELLVYVRENKKQFRDWGKL